MATRDEIKSVIAYLGMAFPNFHPELEGELTAVDVWVDLLGDLDIETLRAASRYCCAQSGRAFAPSAGEIRGAVAELNAQAFGLPTGGEAWGAIMESFQRISSQAPALLQHPLIQQAMHCMGGLERLGMSEDNMADRAHFLKIFEQLRERKMRDAIELPAITEYKASKRMIDERVKMLTDKLSICSIPDQTKANPVRGDLEDERLSVFETGEREEVMGQDCERTFSLEQKPHR